MLKEKDVRSLLVFRVVRILESCNGTYTHHVQGQIRGLMAVLLDGRRVPNYNETSQVLTDAGIPFTVFPRTHEIEFDPAWMEEHGFQLDVKADQWRHERWAQVW